MICHIIWSEKSEIKKIPAPSPIWSFISAGRVAEAHQDRVAVCQYNRWDFAANSSMGRELIGAFSSLQFVDNDPDEDASSRLRRLRYEMLDRYYELPTAGNGLHPGPTETLRQLQ